MRRNCVGDDYSLYAGVVAGCGGDPPLLAKFFSCQVRPPFVSKFAKTPEPLTKAAEARLCSHEFTKLKRKNALHQK